MAETDQVTGLLDGLFSGFLNVSAQIVIGILVLGLILGLVYYFVIYRRKFDIKVKVMSERAQDPKVYFDKGAILKDKKGNKYFRLFKTKVDLEVPNFKIVEQTNHGDYVEIWRKSEDHFLFLSPPRIDKTHVIRADGRAYPVADTSQVAVESDLYWISKQRESNKKLLDPEGILMKLLAWAPQILSGTFMMIILWIFMDKLPEVINILTELVRELQSLKGGVLS